MKKIIITLFICGGVYLYYLYSNELKAGVATSQEQSVSNMSSTGPMDSSMSSGSCSEQNFCTISKERNIETQEVTTSTTTKSLPP